MESSGFGSGSPNDVLSGGYGRNERGKNCSVEPELRVEVGEQSRMFLGSCMILLFTPLFISKWPMPFCGSQSNVFQLHQTLILPDSNGTMDSALFCSYHKLISFLLKSLAKQSRHSSLIYVRLLPPLLFLCLLKVHFKTPKTRFSHCSWISLV